MTTEKTIQKPNFIALIGVAAAAGIVTVSVMALKRQPDSSPAAEPDQPTPAQQVDPDHFRKLIEQMETGVRESVHFREAVYRKSYDKWWMSKGGVYFGEDFSNIAIETEGEAPSDAEFDLLEKVFAMEPEIRAEIQAAIFQRYQEIRDNEVKKMTRELGPEVTAVLLPPISSPEEIWRIAAYSVVELPIQHDDKFRFRIELLCNWDDHYGLRARYIDGEFQGIERGGH